MAQLVSAFSLYLKGSWFESRLAHPMKKKKNPLNKIADEAFWSEFHEHGYKEERYFVVNTRTGEVIVNSARLTKDKKRVKV